MKSYVYVCFLQLCDKRSNGLKNHEFNQKEAAFYVSIYSFVITSNLPDLKFRISKDNFEFYTFSHRKVNLRIFNDL